MFSTQPVRGMPAPAAFITVSGTARVHHQIDHGPRPPIYHLTGLRPTHAEGHRIEFCIPATEWLLGPTGTIGAMACAYLGDGPVGLAVMITTPPGRVTTTAELSLIFHTATSPGGDEILGTGRFLSSDAATGVAACRIEHGGSLLASGITRMAYLDYPIPDGLILEAEEPPTYDGPDPYRRPAVGLTITDRSRPGIDIELERVHDGNLAPIENLLGLSPVAAAGGGCTLSMTASGWHMSPAGNLYGGSMAAAVTAAIESAARTVAPPWREERVLDVKINYIRPVQCDGGELLLTGSVLHAGRRLVVVRVEATRADGKVAAFGQGTAALDPVRAETADP